jgi:hypothetical protein
MVNFTKICCNSFIIFQPQKAQSKTRATNNFLVQTKKASVPKSAQMQAKVGKRITLLKFWNWTTVQMFGTTFPFFQLAVQKSVARFRGVGCVEVLLSTTCCCQKAVDEVDSWLGYSFRLSHNNFFIFMIPGLCVSTFCANFDTGPGFRNTTSATIASSFSCFR